MARIVPAKPKILDEKVLDFFLRLEREMSDNYIIFQNFPIFNSFLITSEGIDAIIVVVVDDAQIIDFDEMTIHRTNNSDLDIDLVINEIMNTIKDNMSMFTPKVVFYTPNLSNSSVPDIKSPILKNEISFLTSLFNPITFLEMKVNTQEFPSGPDKINELINHLSPGSSPYEKNKITEAQLRWRNHLLSNKADATENKELISSGVMSNSVKEEEPLPGNVVKSPSVPVKEVKPDSPKAPMRVEYLEKMIHNILFNLAKNRPIYTSGVEIDPVFVSSKDCLLPAVIIAASEMWTPLVVKKNGKGGFDVRLKTDPQSLLGFTVVDVIPSAPMVLFMPITHLFRTMINDGEFILDDIVSVFARWVVKHELENTHLEEIDLKIALKAIEGS